MNWLVLTLVVLVLGIVLAVITGRRFPWLGKSLAAVVLILALLVTLGTAICYEGPGVRELSTQYAVLLGSALENGEPTDILLQRLELAINYVNSKPDVVLIVSGGDPAGQGVTEAQVMYDWLQDHGADMRRILKEEQARDTRENLLYSRDLARERGLDTYAVMILTSEFHQTRAQYLARQIGQEPNGIGCETVSGWEHVSCAVREVYSFVKAWLETHAA